MSSSEYLIDAASRHAHLLQRYSAGLERKASDIMSDALADLIAQVPEDTSQPMLNLVRNYRGIIESAEDQLYNEFLALAESEADFNKQLFEQAFDADIDPAPVSAIFRAMQTEDLKLVPNQRLTIPVMLASFTTAKANQIGQILNEGFVTGKTQAEVIKEIRKVEPLQRAHAASIARTGTNAVSSMARMQTILANIDILDGYEIVATLDGRTSFLCASLDGNVIWFEPAPDRDFIGSQLGVMLYYEGPNAEKLRINPFPPYHFSCRTTLIPRVKPEFDLLSALEGDRPSVGATGAKTVGAKTEYPGWIKKQPAKFQDEWMGATRGKLFRQGGLSIDKFTNFDGREYNLRELRALYPMAFEKANL